MISLTGLLGRLVAILQASVLFHDVEIVETRVFSSEQFSFKIRADLAEIYTFQVRIYYNRGHIDYAYQLFTDVPLLRWDNKEEVPYLKTYPHHYHEANGNVMESPLRGVPENDIGIVLQAVTTFISLKTCDSFLTVAR